MNNHRTFSIVPLLIAESDLRILKSLTILTASRPRRYALACIGQTPNIYFVDADNPASMAEWQAQKIKNPAPAVLVSGTNKESSASPYVIKHPIIPSRLLALLDTVTVAEWHFVPENVIGNEEPNNISVQSPIEIQGNDRGVRQFTALVVDDSITVRKQIELGLKPFLVNVDCAETGEEGLSKLNTRHYDIIFLDVVLPGADGYQICKAIKKNPATKKTAVVMLTGKSSPFDKLRGAMAGCDTYLTKPVDNTTFQEVVKKYLRVVESSHTTEINPAVLASG